MMPASFAVPREHLLNLLSAVGARHDAIHEVRPIERADQHRRLAEAPVPTTMSARTRGGRGRRERVERDLAEAVAQRARAAGTPAGNRGPTG